MGLLADSWPVSWPMGSERRQLVFSRTTLVLEKFALSFQYSKIACIFLKTMCALRVNLTIYHSLSSSQPLAASKNIWPTRTGNPIYDLHGMINFSNREVTGFWYLKTSNKIWIKRFQKYSLGGFWIMKVVTGLFSFCRFCQSWIFCSEFLQK